MKYGTLMYVQLPHWLLLADWRSASKIQNGGQDSGSSNKWTKSGTSNNLDQHRNQDGGRRNKKLQLWG